MLVADKYTIYNHNIATLKKYGNKYKLTWFKAVRESGWEERYKTKIKEEEKEVGIEEITEKVKLNNNISRSRSTIFELAMCNDWKYFITCTLDKEKYDRTNLKKFQKDLSQFVRDQRKKWKVKIKYILIPELHQDGQSWHMHGLLQGIKDEMVSSFVSGKHPQKLIDKGYVNWKDYYRKFGFVSLGQVKNHEAVAKYITKYISKNLDDRKKELEANLYYCSKGLNRSEIIKTGKLCEGTNWDFQNDYVKIAWFDSLEDGIKKII